MRYAESPETTPIAWTPEGYFNRIHRLLRSAKMDESHVYESFPWPIVILTNLVSLSIYAIGVLVLIQLGLAWAGVYLVYCLCMEFRLLRYSCVNCAYYGGLCGFGKGKVCAWFFKAGDPKKFGENGITWRDLIPDFLVFLIPLVVGIILLVMDFNWYLLVLLVVLIALSTVGNAVIRGSFACKYCKQRLIGCPAEKLFNKHNSEQASEEPPSA